MSLFNRLFQSAPADPKTAMAPLYHAIVHRGRAVHWYVEGAVSDTLDGRFDMIAAILCLVLLRLDHADLRQESVWLTELFIDDMDGQLRQIGIGDLVVGKHVGKMMSALGGRYSAYRDGLAPGGDFDAALRRNLYRDEPVAESAVADVAARLRAFAGALEAVEPATLLKGDLPA